MPGFEGQSAAVFPRIEVQENAIARRYGAMFSRLVEPVRAALARGQGDFLLWDRRVSLACVLMQAKDHNRARKELQRCLEEVDEANPRSLTTASLYHFRIMLRRYELDIESPALRDRLSCFCRRKCGPSRERRS